MPAPEGWHLWPYPPEDCAVFVPDDLASVAPPSWQPCSFMPDGCTEAGAPWAQEFGWGYGSRLSVAVAEGHTYLALARRAASEYWWEYLLLCDNEVVGAWRFSAAGVTGSRCSLVAPRLFANGRAGLHVVREQLEEAPYVFLGAPDTLMAAPERTEVFGPPDSFIIPGGAVLASDRLLTFVDYYGGFAVRDLVTGETFRPRPTDEPGTDPVDPIPVGDAVFYEAWAGDRSSIWVAIDGESASLLRNESESYNQFVTDGTDAAWQRGLGNVDTNMYETIELWTSPLAISPEGLVERKLVTLPQTWDSPPSTWVCGLSIGEGWVAVWLNLQDVRLYRLSDGLERRLPVVPGLVWSGNYMYKGMVIAGGALWMKTSIEGMAGNDIRYIHRFEIDKLPTP